MNSAYLSKLAQGIGKEWRMLAYELGYNSAQIDHLQTAFPHDAHQCICTLLTKWHDVITSNDVKPEPVLVKTLISVDRSDLAERITDEFNVSDVCNGETEGLPIDLSSITFRHKANDLLMYIEQSERFMEFHLKEKHLFVKTRAAKQAEDKLLTERFVVVMGNAGDGKTTISTYLLSRMKAEGCTIIVLSDPALIEQIYDDGKEILYFVDDAFGTPTVNQRLVETWVRLHDKIWSLVECKKCRLLIATRKHVYIKCAKYLGKRRLYAENITDLTQENACLTLQEKNRIIANLCQGSGLFPKRLRLTVSNYISGFPLLCKMFARDKYLQEADDFFEKTLKVLRQQLELLAETQPHSFCGLVMTMIFDGHLSKDVFNPFDPCEEEVSKKLATVMKAYGLNESSDLAKVEKHLIEMSGVYLIEVDEEFRFLHDSIFDTTCLVFGTKFPNEMIRIASPKFIETRIRAESIVSEDDDILIVRRSKYPVLAARWIKDVQRGYIANMFGNPSIQDPDLLKTLIKRIDGLSEIDCIGFLNTKDESVQQSVLELSCIHGIYALFKYITGKIKVINQLNPNRIEMQLSPSFLANAVAKNQVEMAGILLEQGLDVNTISSSVGYQCLHVACKSGSIEMVQNLIKHGADVKATDYKRKQPIHFACEEGKVEIVAILLNAGVSSVARDNTGKEPIHYAAMSGKLNCVKLLIKHGASETARDVFSKEPIHYAASSSSPDVTSFLVNDANLNKKDNSGMTPLHIACRYASSDNVRRLLQTGADVNSLDHGKCTPLHSSCKGGQQDPMEGHICAELLVNAGANVNALDKHGRNPMFYACELLNDRRVNTVRFLIRHGANVKIKDKTDRQPISYACESGSFKILRLLVDFGLNVNYNGKEGKRPMHYVCAKGREQFAAYLFSRGALLSPKDDKGKQPIHYASQHGNDDCLLFLIRNGVDLNVKDNLGLTPLHYACKWSRQSTVRELMFEGANPIEQDNDSQTPADIVPKWSTRKSRIQRLLRSESFSNSH